MSYDLQLVGGDISFGVDGNPVVVTDTAKLAQDISKLMLTPLGSDPGNAQYGVKLRNLLGRPMDFTTIQGMVAKTVSQGITFLQSLQAIQATIQTVTYLEMIGSVNAISVLQTSDSGIEVQIAVTSVAGLRQVYAMQLSGKNNS